MEGRLLWKERYPGGGIFQVVAGDLLRQDTEAVVNAANGRLAHGGGVAGAISRAAGPGLQRESDALVAGHGPFASGEAAATGAGLLPFAGVVHAVGPRQGEGDEEETLARALTAAFTLAADRGWGSISFPAVSAGTFGVPPATCARAYLRSVRGYFGEHPSSPLRLIRLVLLPGPVLDGFLREAGQQTSS